MGSSTPTLLWSSLRLIYQHSDLQITFCVLNNVHLSSTDESPPSMLINIASSFENQSIRLWNVPHQSSITFVKVLWVSVWGDIYVAHLFKTQHKLCKNIGRSTHCYSETNNAINNTTSIQKWEKKHVLSINEELILKSSNRSQTCK